MKKALFTMAIVLLAVAAQAQNTAIKVHSDGQISLQSATTSGGIQIPTSGIVTFHPNLTAVYQASTLARVPFLLNKSWEVRLSGNVALPSASSFYVLGNGNVYAYGNYLTYSPNDSGSKDAQHIEGASDMVAMMKGYYYESTEFEGVDPEDFEGNENILPEALDGLLKDLEKDRVVGMNASEMEEILPEAVRHCPDGNMAINYNAVVAVLVEAFKEQQAKIEQMEAVLRENGLLR